MEIIKKAVKEGRTSLSEYEAKQILATYQIPVNREIQVKDVNDLVNATQKIGYPLVLKGCSSDIMHKTENGLIHIDIRNEEEAISAFEKITRNMNGTGDGVLVQEMIKGHRELVIGMTRDPQFGPCVMFGIGGIFTEILQDVTFYVAPLQKKDALKMMKGIKGHKILDAVRGMEAADKDKLAEILINVGRIGIENEQIKEIDINPVIISESMPVAVDALIILMKT